MLTLGSLFDGSGGFPLAGTLHGIKPLWASEIEPYPIRVTKTRFPEMKHLGSVLDVKGGEVEPVDIITFGSPCQDLSVAGKQKGIHEGERSSLFFEAVRIAKEMRDHDRATGRADVNLRPRFLVWENVPGAFSSNQGEDFRAVLEALGGIAEDGLSIPRPAKGKWNHAGCVVGDGWSIAWRMYDAQYWGVPQRRKRIYLIADFASERSGEILFEREGLRWHSETSGKARQGTAGNAQGGVGRSCHAFHLQQDPIGGDVSPCIGGQHQATVGVVASFMGGQGAKAGGIAYSEEHAPTLRSAPSGTNTAPDVVYPSAGFSDALGERAQGGMGYTEDGCPSLRAGDVRAVVYDARGNGGGCTVPTLTGDHQNRITDYTAIGVFDMKGFGEYGGGRTMSTIKARDHKDATDLVIEQRSPRRYIVRRLTPLECCRLQGFPDWWEDGVQGSDSARYKMWGNGIALPCAADVLGRIAKEVTK